jgi:DNA topoisomerase-1
VSVETLEDLKKPQVAAQAAGLRYVTDQMPGISRQKSGAGFRYIYPTGEAVKEEPVLERIKSLVIPPAWNDVWICPDPAGHLQATGRDQRGRKQSRYHPCWREIRDETKYTRMIAFAEALPDIRKRANRDLKLPGLPRNKVLATVVRLLEVSLIRVGNEEYAKENHSFGLTTLRNRHVEVRGSTMRFHFRGKSGKWHDVNVRDRRLARIIRSCQDLPGQELFQYISEDGKREKVSSEDVNAYLREISSEDFTAKDFRTWVGTVYAALALQQFEPFHTESQAKKNLAQAIKAVAQLLGNTPSVCRKCYVHPEIVGAYLKRKLIEGLKPAEDKNGDDTSLRPEEIAVLKFLRKQAKGS